MFTLGSFSVQLIDSSGNSCLIDCDTFDNARSRARGLSRRHEPCMLNIIEWDHRKLTALKEWFLLENCEPVRYKLNCTLQ